MKTTKIAQAAGKKEKEAAWDRMLLESHREARATLWAGLAAFLWFWGTLLAFLESPATLFGLPLWFMLAVVGGWLLTTALAWALTRRVFSEDPIDVHQERTDA